MTDVVYILGRGSRWENNEIRYSLRSIEKHLKNFGNIYIVGELPEFLKDIRHISCADDNFCKENNIYFKVLRACQERDISNQFLFFNDDHFLMQDFDADTFPYFHKGDLVETIKRLNNKYRRCCLRTARTLHTLRLPTNNFDTHTPILYDKHLFIDRMTKFEWGLQVGYILKSLYCNVLKIEGVREADCKINRKMSLEELDNIVSCRKVWSMGDEAIHEPLKVLMNQLYPTPSRWER